MKKPWQVWTIFLLCLALVVPAMAWLTMEIVQRDHLRENDRVDTELARREAELQDIVNSAVYRMDWKLSPIVAQEAARPYYMYQSFYMPASLFDLESEKGGKGAPNSFKDAVAQEQASPLLYQTSEYVRLHFQIKPDNKFSSPQRPESESTCEKAFACCNVTLETINENASKLEEASKFCDYKAVLACCSSDSRVDAIAQAPTLAANSILPAAPQQQAYQQQITQPNVPQYSGRGGNLKVDNKTIAQQQFNVQRGANDYQKRQQSTGNYANEWAKNRLENLLTKKPNPNSPEPSTREGVMRPVWLNDNLLLARRVDVAGETIVQCCWLDWERIEKSLREEVSDLLPDLQFEPLKSGAEPDYSRVLATLPVQVVVDSPKMLASLALDRKSVLGKSMSGLRLAMLLAWCGLGLATLATAGLLHGVMKLSERRASFVSAVTHELRTPLTTFKMYSEMLAEKMVPADKQQKYAQTLQTQADRLSHLVENVLQFAKLERNPKESRTEEIKVSDLFARFDGRLKNRADQVDMRIKLDISQQDQDRVISTDAQTVEQIVFNLVDNACKYASSAENRDIELTAGIKGNELKVVVRDFGPGVEPKFRAKMFQPFCKSDLEAANSAPGVGLGLALCVRMARSLGGKLSMNDTAKGAEFVLRIPV